MLTYSRSGQVRALGTTGSTRAPAEPELPTMAEAGVPGYVVDSWQGVFAPKNTPPDIVAALANPATAEQLARSAYTARGSLPEELRDFLKADAEKWNAVIKTAGLKID